MRKADARYHAYFIAINEILKVLVCGPAFE